MAAALEGIRVLEMGAYTTGPMAGKFLANLGAPQDCLDPEDQLLNRKRFRYIVVSAEFQALDNLLIGGLGGQHYDGLIAVLGANPVANLIAVHPGQHDVEQDQIELARQRLFEALRARGRTIGCVAMEHEHIDEARAYGLFVLHYQYAYLSFHQDTRLALWRHRNRDSM